MSNNLRDLAQRMRQHLQSTDENYSTLPPIDFHRMAMAASALQDQSGPEQDSRPIERTNQPTASAASASGSNSGIGSAMSGSNIGAGSTTVFSEVAPIILATELPQNVNVPRRVWEGIYDILRRHGGEWTDIRVLHADYMIYMKTPLSNKFLKENCGVRSIKELLTYIPWVKIKYSVDGNMYVQLSPTKIKKSHRSVDQRPARIPREATALALFEDDYEWAWDCHLIPPQPECVLPPGTEIPQDLRQQVYDLLANWYPTGIDISTFAEAFNKRYGFPINTGRSCRMALDTALYLMADIIDAGRGYHDGRLWVRPIPYETIKKLFTEEELRKHELEISGENNEHPPLIKPNEPRDPRELGEKIRAEVKEMLSCYKNGIKVEALSILYNVNYPDRGMNREHQHLLKQWLEAMSDFVDVFEKEENGQVCAWTTLKQ